MPTGTLQGMRGFRVLIYSHDTMGLGHLRRCSTIAHSLVRGYPDVSVLILSGSPIIGSFDFRSRIDFVRIPGVIKLRNGEYTSLNLGIDFEQTIHMRAEIIKHTADIFAPDMVIVDKEPLGLRGEIEDTLRMLKRRGTRLILGLRDIMDDPCWRPNGDARMWCPPCVICMTKSGLMVCRKSVIPYKACRCRARCAGE